MTDEKIDLSIIVPVLNEADSLPELHRELTAVLSGRFEPYEILIVDDGSTDGTAELLQMLKKRDPHLKVLRFRRNFGKAAALSKGFGMASGRKVVTLDGDLQDDPAEIPRLLEKLEEGYDLVSGWKVDRKDPLSKTLPSKLFNRVTAVMSGLPLHDFNCGLKGYRREVVKSLRIYGELHRYIPVLAHREGFRVCEVEVRHRPRRHGRTKYGRQRFTKGFLDFITILFLTKYLYSPLHFFGRYGLYVFAAGFSICCYLTILWFRGIRPIGNRPLLSLGILLLIFGLQFISTGLIGELIIRRTSTNEEPIPSEEREPSHGTRGI